MAWKEAQLRNVFSIAINLDRNTWKVEVGDANALVFSNPEEAKEYTETIKSRCVGLCQQREDANLSETALLLSLKWKTMPSTRKNRRRIYFSFVYTPQYGEDGMRPTMNFPTNLQKNESRILISFPMGRLSIP